MRRTIKLGVATAVAGISCATFASAATDTYNGPTDDEGETVSIEVTENKNGKVKKIKSFTANQNECGSTTLEPKHPRKLENGHFTLKKKVGGHVVFKVTGGVPTQGVLQGEYEQIACDGGTDSWVAYDSD